MISRTIIYTLLFSNMASGYLKHLIDAMLYLAMGALIFGINLGKGNAPLAILVLVLGMVSTFGLGMLLSQIFFYTSTGKGGPNAVLMLASTFANTFSGATFPVEVIIAYAPWLYPISAFLPQTHTLSVIRIILNGASLSDFSVLSHIIYLIIFAFITIPIGTYLFRKGLDHIRKEGYAPHELGIWLY
jgi:ABC-type multidrug transport system permease subunit